MRTIRNVIQFARDHWLITLAVLVNLAIAAPAQAIRWDNDVCELPDTGERVACCTTCWFFCDCTEPEVVL
jgi:hypothetical protein